MNKVQCKICLDIIVSHSIHDLVHCKCGSVALDGGGKSLRVIYPSGNVSDWVELNEDKFVKGESTLWTRLD